MLSAKELWELPIKAEVLCWGLGMKVVQAMGADKGLGEEAGRTSPGSGNNPP